MLFRSNIELKGTSHSHGAAKSWKKLASNPDIKIHGEHPDGTKVELKHEDIGTSKTHVSPDSKDPVKKMALIATRRT